jgi:hypothetical protein
MLFPNVDFTLLCDYLITEKQASLFDSLVVFTVFAASTLPSCTFEESECGWKVDGDLNNTEAFCFIRVQGKDLIPEAGPIADHQDNHEGKHWQLIRKVLGKYIMNLGLS